MSGIDWDHRELCPDGACNGIVSDEGVCKVCGKAVPNWGDERMRGLANEEDEDEDDEEDADEGEDEGDEYEDDEEDDGEEDEDDDAVNEASGDWTERKLCDDGACVGVIGSDGTCTVCGKRSAA